MSATIRQFSPTPRGPATPTPLEVSQAMLESEENPSTLRARTPAERLAEGETDREPDALRASLRRALHHPATLWGCVALCCAMAAALVYRHGR